MMPCPRQTKIRNEIDLLEQSLRDAFASLDTLRRTLDYDSITPFTPFVLIEKAVAARAPGFRGGWISANAVRALLIAKGIKLPSSNHFMPRMLERMGYTECRRVRTSPSEAMRFPSSSDRTRLYARPDVDMGYTPMAVYDAAQGV